jgi:anti-sigma regulatory factor (Ser/Thr protein kinase)
MGEEAHVGRTVAARRATPRSFLLPRAPASVRQGRRLLGADLGAARVDAELTADAQTILSELMTNAIRHARPYVDDQIKIMWTLAPNEIEVRVSDGGSRHVPMVQHPSATEIGGRGLALVDGLADAWGVDRTDGSSTVWAVIGLP